MTYLSSSEIDAPRRGPGSPVLAVEDLHVEFRAQSIEGFCACHLAADIRRRKRRRQRRRDVPDDTHESVDLRACRGAVAIGEQQARDDFSKASRRIEGEHLPVRTRVGSTAWC